MGPVGGVKEPRELGGRWAVSPEGRPWAFPLKCTGGLCEGQGQALTWAEKGDWPSPEGVGGAGTLWASW